MLALSLSLTVGKAGSLGPAVVRLPAPTGLSVTEGATTVDASWDAVVGATGYEYNIGAGWVDNSTSTSVTGVSVSYGAGTFLVRAYDANSGRIASAEFSIAYPVPGAPQSLSVLVDDLDYEATWDAPASNAAYVTYYRVRINGGSWANNGTSTTYVGSGTAGSYTIDVDAVNADGADGADASDTFDLTDPAPTTFTYLRPDGTSTYLRPDGVSQYIRP